MLVQFLVVFGLAHASSSPYKKDKVVGQGANAFAWLALDESGEYDEVVVKSPKNEKGAAGLQREFYLMQEIYELNHDRFPVPIRIVNDIPDTFPEIVMERLGKDLSKMPPTQEISLTRIAEIGLYMIDTLGILHEARYTHGDAHAGNWLLPVEGSFEKLVEVGTPIHLKLIDFGTVKPIEEINLVKDFNFVLESMTLLSHWVVDEDVEYFKAVFKPELKLGEHWRCEFDSIIEYLTNLVALEAVLA
jgi:serine/threonine protein kinase